MEKIRLSISLVAFRNNREVLTKTVNSVLQSEGISFHLYIVDNSPTDEIGEWFQDNRLTYISNKFNCGFGKAHNQIMIDKSKLGKYHLVLNPDIYFNKDVLKGLYDYMEKNPDVGNIIPKTFYPNGTLCPVCRLLPTPSDFFLRMFIPLKSWRQKVANNYLMGFCDFNRTINAPYLSGCFMFLRTEAIEKVGVFDDKMFMYAEDVDLSRRIHAKYKTLYYPEISIIHHGAEESHKNWKLFKIHTQSCIYYLNKWGWFFDKERKQVNKVAIEENTLRRSYIIP